MLIFNNYSKEVFIVLFGVNYRCCDCVRHRIRKAFIGTPCEVGGGKTQPSHADSTRPPFCRDVETSKKRGNKIRDVQRRRGVTHSAIHIRTSRSSRRAVKRAASVHEKVARVSLSRTRSRSVRPNSVLVFTRRIVTKLRY